MSFEYLKTLLTFFKLFALVIFLYNGLNIEFTRGQKRVDVCYALPPSYNCLPVKWYDTQCVSEFGTKCTPVLYLPLSVSSYLCPPIICIIEGRAQ